MDIGEKRLLAAIFDYIFIMIITKLVSFILPIGNNNSIFYDYGLLLIFVLLFIYKDSLFKSGSLGKKIFGIGIYDENNNYASNAIKIKRNKAVFRDFPHILFTLEKNPMRYCDIKYKTRIDVLKKQT